MTRSERQRPGGSRAWLCLLVNQLAFPGLGTILAGRRIGYVQATVMVTGFCLVMLYMIWFFVTYIRLMLHQSPEALDLTTLLQHHGWIGLAGLILCGLAWFWALASSLAIIHRVQTGAPPASFGPDHPLPPPLPSTSTQQTSARNPS